MTRIPLGDPVSDVGPQPDSEDAYCDAWEATVDAYAELRAVDVAAGVQVDCPDVSVAPS
jgi:hypothetical protein